MPYTILHLSDLHRSSAHPIRNDELISALLSDRDRYAKEAPVILAPDAIVVTGDLVYGAALGADGYAADLDEQYAVAENFLELLSQLFLDGDRSRLVIVPGNHDVDWNGAKAAMRLAEGDEIPNRFTLQNCTASSDLRWDWRERRIYKIVERDLYEQRLLRFDRLVERFYAATDVRSTPLFRIHQLAEGRICLVAFNSCHGNDPFTLQGCIKEGAIAEAHLTLRELRPTLAVAAWHHNIERPPPAIDYMDPVTVAEMIGKGFRLGLHGHQHRADAVHRYVRLPDEERMAVISAGSLCAGGADLPTGVNRQYNVVEIDDDLEAARVHVREVVTGTIFAPARRSEFGLHTYVDLKWERPAGPLGGGTEDEPARLEAADRALGEGHPERVPEALGDLVPAAGSYARRLLAKALEALGRWEELATLLDPPTNSGELFQATNALVEAGTPDVASAFLQSHYEAAGLTAVDIQELERYISAKKAMQ
jgi:predicted MPP superfamily phosphohydrolase